MPGAYLDTSTRCRSIPRTCESGGSAHTAPAMSASARTTTGRTAEGTYCMALSAGEPRRALLDEVRDALAKVLGCEALRHLGIRDLERLVEVLVGGAPDLRFHHRHRARRHGVGKRSRVCQHVVHELVGR